MTLSDTKRPLLNKTRGFLNGFVLPVPLKFGLGFRVPTGIGLVGEWQDNCPHFLFVFCSLFMFMKWWCTSVFFNGVYFIVTVFFFCFQGSIRTRDGDLAVDWIMARNAWPKFKSILLSFANSSWLALKLYYYPRTWISLIRTDTTLGCVNNGNRKTSLVFLVELRGREIPAP